jgi:hypothetical protein
MSSFEPTPEIPSTATDLELLRAFEPVVRYTSGEMLYPMDVERYVIACSLWLYHPDEEDEEIVPEGALTMDSLVEPRAADFGSIVYLRFVGPMGLDESAHSLADLRQLKRKQGTVFRAGLGRLARGGLLPRMGDALFSASLLLRGKVPGATAAAAVLKYQAIHARAETYVYHGRVVQQSGWTICQYWFFFAYNNWRSGFHGVNDHESDWEMVAVYLYEQGGALTPEWVAYASHDFHGADLRRRWDDRADLELEAGRHPVVYAGAGSHASYFRPGEYQAEVALPVPNRLRSFAGALHRFWTETLGQGGDTEKSPFRVPFIDFARGDGLAVGPGQTKAWSPDVIDERVPWTGEYRGLWGLYAQDPISGENAPAGPMYNRDGSPRSSWFDPLGFAGLDRVPPPPLELELLDAECSALSARQEELELLIPEEAGRLQELGARLQSMERVPHLAAEHERLARRVVEQATRVKEFRRERTQNEAVLEGLTGRLARLERGERDDARAHIRQGAAPFPPEKMRFNRAAEIWAAASLSLLLVGLFALILWSPGNVWAGVIVLIIVFVVGESFLRGTFVRTVNRVAVILALAAAVILFVHFWKEVVLAILIGLAGFLIVQRLREFRA